MCLLTTPHRHQNFIVLYEHLRHPQTFKRIGSTDLCIVSDRYELFDYAVQEHFE